MQAAIGVSRHDEDFQKHLNQVTAPLTFAPELAENIRNRNLLLFALFKQPDGHFFLLRIQPHLPHDLLGSLDFITGHTPVSLGDMAHHVKSGSKKGRLDFLDIRALHTIQVNSLHAPVKIMPQGRTQCRAQRTTQHKAEGAADDFTPPAQKKILINQGRLNSRSQP